MEEAFNKWLQTKFQERKEQNITQGLRDQGDGKHSDRFQGE